MELYINKYDDGNIKSVELIDVPRNKFRGDWLNEYTKFPQTSVFNVSVMLNKSEDLDIITALQNEGFSLGIQPNPDGDAEVFYLNTKVSFVNFNKNGYGEPDIKQIIGDKGIQIHEKDIATLRGIDLESCDLEMNVWKNQNDELKLYCNKLYLDCKKSRFSDKYSDVEMVN